MSTPPTPPTPPTRSTPPPETTFQFRRPVFVMLDGKRYTLEVLDRSGQIITDKRDWKEIAISAHKAAKEYLQAANIHSDDMRPIEITLQGDLSIPESTTPPSARTIDIQQIKYNNNVINAAALKSTLPPQAQAKIQSQLADIGRLVGAYQPYVPSPQPSPTPQTPPPTPEHTYPTLPKHTKKTPTADEILCNYMKDVPLETTPKTFLGALSDQIKTLNPISEENLQLKIASYIFKNPGKFVNHYPEILSHLQAVTKSNATELEKLVKEGEKTLTADELTTVKALIAGTISSPSQSNKELLVKAYANFIHGTKPYSSKHIIYNKTTLLAAQQVITKESHLIGSDKDKNLSLVLLKKGSSAIEVLDKAIDTTAGLIPAQTAFLFYDPTNAAEPFKSYQRKAAGKPSLGILNFPGRPTPLTDKTTPPTYYNNLALETGGGGNCAASSLHDAVLQFNKQHYSSDTEWKRELEIGKAEIREEAIGYILDHPEQFTNDPIAMIQLRQAIRDSEDAIKTALPVAKSELERLKDKVDSALTKEDQNFLVRLYAQYALENGKDLDAPFFRAYALKNNKQIAILRYQGDKHIIRQEDVYPTPGAIINKDNCLFVFYADGHYKSVLRTHKALTKVLKAYGTGLGARNDFLQALSANATQADNTAYINAMKPFYERLQREDEHAYLALGYFIWDKDQRAGLNPTGSNYGHDQLNNNLVRLKELSVAEIQNVLLHSRIEGSYLRFDP